MLRAAADGAIKLGAMKRDSFSFFLFFLGLFLFAPILFVFYSSFKKWFFFSSFDGRNKTRKQTDVGCVVSPFAHDNEMKREKTTKARWVKETASFKPGGIESS